MSFYNGILNHKDDDYQFLRGAMGLPGIKGDKGDKGDDGDGYHLTSDGDYDIQNKKLVNVKNGVNGSDVVTKSQLDAQTSLLQGARSGYVVNDKAAVYSGTGALHAQSLYLKDTPDNAGNSDEIRIITEHQSYSNIHLYVPDLKNYDGYGGRPRSVMMISSIEQTITGKKTFQNIEVLNPTSNNQATNKYYVDHNFLNRITGGQIGGDLDMRGNTIKYLKLDNTESAAARVAELNLKLNRSGDTMTGDLILPHYNYPVQGNTDKAVSYNTTRSIFLSRKESSPMDVDINMNNNLIQNVATPTSSHQATNKGYCDYNFLNRHKGPDTPKFGYSAVNKNYVDGEISKITTIDTNQFVLKSGSTMTGDLNMKNHLITNIKKPTRDNDNKTNVFKYLNDPNQTSSERNITVNSFGDWINSPHKYNKRAYDVTLQRHSGTDSYDSKIGINLYSAGAGKFTLVFEFPNPIEFSNVNITASASTAIIHKQTQRNLINHTKVVIQVDNSSLKTPDYLYYRITGVATQAAVQAHVIIYGVRGWVDSVDPGVYDDIIHYLDDIFKDNNGDMKMKKDINLDNHLITNLRDGVNSSDCVNKRQLDSVSYYTNNHTYREIFDEFYDMIGTSRFNLNKNAFGVVILGVMPNLFLGTNRYLNNYDKIHGLQMNNGYINLKNKVNQNTSFTIFISLYFSSDIKIQFSSDIVSQNGYYPSYSISNNRLRITESSSISYHTTLRVIRDL